MPNYEKISYDMIKIFFEKQQVLSCNIVDDIVRNAKILPYDGDAELFGVYENGRVVLPKITDDLTVLIAIHELVHMALLRKENINELIKYGEDLPIFYELLFQHDNGFIDSKVHTTPSALILLNDYHNEVFDEQIKKLERVIK